MAHLDYMEIDLPVAKLELGMHVVALDRPWNETSFLIQGFVISSEVELFNLQEQCEFVQVQVKSSVGLGLIKSSEGQMAKLRRTQESDKIAAATTTDTKKIRKQYHRNRVDFNQGVADSMMTFADARKIAFKIMASVKSGRAINIKECRAAVIKIVDCVLSNSDALRFLSQIKHVDSYTAEHCMNCCVLCATFGRHLGMNVEDIQTLALSALLHDVGKARIPKSILEKKERLTKEEALMMAKHSELGFQILMKLPENNHQIADVAYSHHEREDGQGYPRHLHNKEISIFTKIVALADCYDAMTSRRCYGSIHSSSKSLDIIRENAGNQFDSGLAKEFVKCIGEYPPGCLVEMTNGEVGIVISSKDEYGIYPKVLMVRDQFHKEMANNRIVDTRLGDLDAINNTYEVLQEIPNGSFGVNLENYISHVTQAIS